MQQKTKKIERSAIDNRHAHTRFDLVNYFSIKDFYHKLCMKLFMDYYVIFDQLINCPSRLEVQVLITDSLLFSFRHSRWLTFMMRRRGSCSFPFLVMCNWLVIELRICLSSPTSFLYLSWQSSWLLWSFRSYLKECKKCSSKAFYREVGFTLRVEFRSIAFYVLRGNAWVLPLGEKLTSFTAIDGIIYSNKYPVYYSRNSSQISVMILCGHSFLSEECKA